MRTTCCIAGGGPAGAMLGFLLARAGIETIVLEKHKDFFRDFRGDTVHPSTLEVMSELGLLEAFLRVPHDELATIKADYDGTEFTAADLTHLPTRCRFIAIMPQWDFLSFIAEQGKRYPTFQILMEHEVTDLVWEGDRVVGVRAKTPAGETEIRAELVVGADGRGSTVRAQTGLETIDLGAPIDVLWMRLSRRPTDPGPVLGHLRSRLILVMINRNDYWQCGYVIPKGTLDGLRQEGIENFRRNIVLAAPFVADRVSELRSWDDIKLLSVQVNRLRQWHRPGLLCIGDAAHAMSPVGGIGINLAIQDAVAASNILTAPLRAHTVTEADLHRVQERRTLPTVLTQRGQVAIQKFIFHRLSGGTEAKGLPLPVKLLMRFPWLRRIPARLLGVGVRPEHVRTSEAPPR